MLYKCVAFLINREILISYREIERFLLIINIKDREISRQIGILGSSVLINMSLRPNTALCGIPSSANASTVQDKRPLRMVGNRYSQSTLESLTASHCTGAKTCIFDTETHKDDARRQQKLQKQISSRKNRCRKDLVKNREFSQKCFLRVIVDLSTR